MPSCFRPAEEDIKELAQEELESLQERREHLEYRLRLALLPKDPNDERDVIVEVRAGTGGEEAALFAAELYRMYARYAQDKGWAVDVIDSNPTGIGGFKEIVFEVKGKSAFSRLKYERGAHRVQRVPTTEAGGRIHTSAATVAVLPEAEEVELDVDPGDLRIDIFHSSGHGGQNVQKVATAVRITHTPTGIAAVCQDERSQLKNRAAGNGRAAGALTGQRDEPPTGGSGCCPPLPGWHRRPVREDAHLQLPTESRHRPSHRRNQP